VRLAAVIRPRTVMFALMTISFARIRTGVHCSTEKLSPSGDPQGRTNDVASPADDRHNSMTVWGVWRDRFASTPFRTFLVFPLLVFAYELYSEGRNFSVQPYGFLFLIIGYGLYRYAGRYRSRLGGGGPGIANPPERLVTAGPYGYVRNPMYLGHLIFMYGLVLTFMSWFAVALLAFHMVWFHRRVIDDEARMRALFGNEYEDYARRVTRWIPGFL
jgi:protein-S-isoprenylcysteine O-methyltransferase Ste14